MPSDKSPFIELRTSANALLYILYMYTYVDVDLWLQSINYDIIDCVGCFAYSLAHRLIKFYFTF